MKTILSFFITCCCLSVYSQHNVSGMITNTAGEPLIGVNISEKGTMRGTVTDYHGVYRMTVKDEYAVLIISYVGYETMEEVMMAIPVCETWFRHAG